MQMQNFEKHVWAEIDLDALRHNFRAVKARAGELPLCAVVKADSYGHGAVQCARVFAQEGAAWLAVSCLTEAVQLRQDGQTLPILILGHVQPEYAQTLIHEDITVACYSTEQAQNLSAAAVKAGGRVKIHLKADTGMGRIGFTADDDMERAVAEMAEACALPGLVPVGVFTHFAAADSTAPEDIAYTRRQYDILCAAVEEMAARGCTFAVKHCCNSAGTFAWPEFHLDMVRPGIILYGEQPSADTVLPGLVPALRLRAAVSMVKELAAGDAVSYGCTFRAPKPMRAATLAVGYADGYPRALSGRGTVSLHGRPARVLGRVCMDQIVVDVTDIPDVKAGDAAIVFGGGAADSVDDVARMTGTINYEVLCDVGRRVQRVYVENGAEVELVDYLKGE